MPYYEAPNPTVQGAMTALAGGNPYAKFIDTNTKLADMGSRYFEMARHFPINDPRRAYYEQLGQAHLSPSASRDRDGIIRNMMPGGGGADLGHLTTNIADQGIRLAEPVGPLPPGAVGPQTPGPNLVKFYRKREDDLVEERDAAAQTVWSGMGQFADKLVAANKQLSMAGIPASGIIAKGIELQKPAMQDKAASSISKKYDKDIRDAREKGDDIYQRGRIALESSTDTTPGNSWNDLMYKYQQNDRSRREGMQPYTDNPVVQGGIETWKLK